MNKINEFVPIAFSGQIDEVFVGVMPKLGDRVELVVTKVLKDYVGMHFRVKSEEEPK